MKKPWEQEFKEQLKVAQPKVHDIWKGAYKPEVHFYAERMAENKKIPSLYTANKIETTIKAK